MPDPLRTLLQEWEIKPTANVAFAARVWRRIAERSHPLRWRRRISDVLGMPVPAATVVMVAVLAGFVAGEVWRRHHAAQERDAGLAAYVLAVDPIARTAALEP
ncbi:hypothetical protein [Opitutus terrae]|uniref:Uncharacterized protein n=1 Tax=Opitutus terrae (strain DSM 11246 / JCM 15787 / PB90-1) TaxID=452637 RepID=B1ZPY4_OPITP|nr:hypothetical protein [Opitutus terrae]ACB77705.1 hypothetical protein Oter_4434 [Opitutus terrae PB90-1]